MKKIGTTGRVIFIGIILVVALGGLFSYFFFMSPSHQEGKNKMIKMQVANNETAWIVMLETGTSNPLFSSEAFIMLLREKDGQPVELSVNGTTYTTPPLEICKSNSPLLLNDSNEVFYGDGDNNKRVSAGDIIVFYRFADDGKPIDGYTLLLLDKDGNVIGSVVLGEAE